MRANKKIILVSFLMWIFVSTAAYIRFGDPLVALTIFAIPAILVPDATGFLAVLVYVLVLGVFAVFAWRTRKTPIAAAFCCVLLVSTVFGWVLTEQLRSQLSALFLPLHF